MNPSEFEQVRALFHAVCELPEPQREQYLRANCADSDVRRHVNELLQADSAGPGPLSGLGAAVERQVLGTRRRSNANDTPPTIGPYEVIRVIGEGGMGVVYEASQSFPQRTVAIKVLRPSSAHPALERRLEHEAYVLGRLQHPGIAQIFEAGRERRPDGDRLYLVMELVRGKNLLAFAAAKGYGVRERVALFIRVCDAIQHAHQKGVIHRDLKPANILVMDDDGERPSGASANSTGGWSGLGRPKVLDFGIARMTDADLQVTTQHTLDGQLIGTLQYMSPEQVVGNPDEIDTRSDVYSLGVLLHELLTGAMPYDVRNRSMLEAARIIREQAPTRLGATDRSLRGDLETIVLRALEKEKSRRYASAADLSSDLRAYLDGTPISARRDSAWYLLQNTLRRYRLAASLTGGLLVLAVASAVVFALLYQRAERAVGAARLERDRAAVAEKEAVQQARRSERMAGFLTDMLRSSDPRAVGREATVKQALDYARRNLDRELADDDETRARVLHTLSEIYSGIGQFDEGMRAAAEAIELMRRSRPAGRVELANTIAHYGSMLINFGRMPEGIARLEEALEMHRRLLPAGDVEIAYDLCNLGAAFRLQGKLDDAERLMRESVRLFEQITAIDAETIARQAVAWNGLATILFQRERPDEALRAAANAVRLFEDSDQRTHPQYLSALDAMAAAERARGNIERARQLHEQVLGWALAIHGPDDPDTANAFVSSAQFERLHGAPERSEELFAEAVAIRRLHFPDGHPEFGYPLSGQGAALLKLGRAVEAELVLREAYEIRIRHAPDQLTTGMTAADFGEALRKQGRYAEAEAPLLHGYRLLKQFRGATARATRTALENLVAAYEGMGDLEAATCWRYELAAGGGR